MKPSPKFPQPILRAEAWPGAVKLIGRERTVCFATSRHSGSERGEKGSAGVPPAAGGVALPVRFTPAARFNFTVLPRDFKL